MGDDLVRSDFGVTACLSFEEWLGLRDADGIGASEGSAFFVGGNRWQSAASVIVRKVQAPRTAPWATREPDRADLAIRRRMEAGLLENYQAIDAVRATAFRSPSDRPTLYWRRATPHILATPDAIVPAPQPAARVVVDFKMLATTAEAWDEGGIPLEYQVQAQQQMYCTGALQHEIAVCFFGSNALDFRVYPTEADAEFQAILVERLSEAWQIVEALRRGEDVPLPDAGPDDSALLARFRPPVPAKVVQMAPADLELATRWLGRKAEKGSYQKIVDGLDELEKADRHALISRMNGAELATFEGSALKLKSKVVSRAGYPVAASSWVSLKEIES